MTEKIRVLLIEDSQEDAKFVAIQLKQSFGTDFELQASDYLSKAAELLRAQSFDVIILDLSLPDCNGLNAFKSLLELSDAPVIIYTGLNDALVKSEAIHAGAFDYLIKGETHSSLLRETVIRCLEKGSGE